MASELSENEQEALKHLEANSELWPARDLGSWFDKRIGKVRKFMSNDRKTKSFVLQLQEHFDPDKHDLGLQQDARQTSNFLAPLVLKDRNTGKVLKVLQHLKPEKTKLMETQGSRYIPENGHYAVLNILFSICQFTAWGFSVDDAYKVYKEGTKKKDGSGAITPGEMPHGTIKLQLPTREQCPYLGSYCEALVQLYESELLAEAKRGCKAGYKHLIYDPKKLTAKMKSKPDTNPDEWIDDKVEEIFWDQKIGPNGQLKYIVRSKEYKGEVTKEISFTVPLAKWLDPGLSPPTYADERLNEMCNTIHSDRRHKECKWEWVAETLPIFIQRNQALDKRNPPKSKKPFQVTSAMWKHISPMCCGELTFVAGPLQYSGMSDENKVVSIYTNFGSVTIRSNARGGGFQGHEAEEGEDTEDEEAGDDDNDPDGEDEYNVSTQVQSPDDDILAGMDVDGMATQQPPASPDLLSHTGEKHSLGDVAGEDGDDQPLKPGGKKNKPKTKKVKLSA